MTARRPPPIRAEIVGDDTCNALGVTVRERVPVLDLCRKLTETGHDPRLPLHAYRGDILCLTVRAIGAGAKLTVTESGTRFVAWRPFPSFAVSPRIAPNRRGAP
jgi:hypothetical protein